MTEAISETMAKLPNSNNYFRNITFDKADEIAPLPMFSTFANRRVESVLQANNVEESGYDLLDDETGMPVDDISQWQLAVMKEEAEALEKDTKSRVTYDGDGYYLYDSNADGHYETSVWFDDENKLGAISVYDEYETGIDSIHVNDKECVINYGQDNKYSEFADTKLLNLNPGDKTKCEGTNAFIFSQHYGLNKDAYNVTYDGKRPVNIEKVIN